jgi:hypothetical protein
MLCRELGTFLLILDLKKRMIIFQVFSSAYREIAIPLWIHEEVLR